MPSSRRAVVLAGLLAGFASSAQAVRPPTPEEMATFFRAVQLDDVKTVQRCWRIRAPTSKRRRPTTTPP